MPLYFNQQSIGIPKDDTEEYNEFNSYAKKFFRRVKRCLKCQEIKMEDTLRGDNYIGGRYCDRHSKQYPVYTFDLDRK